MAIIDPVEGEAAPWCMERCHAYQDVVAERDNLLAVLDRIARIVGANDGNTWSTIGVLGGVERLAKERSMVGTGQPADDYRPAEHGADGHPGVDGLSGGPLAERTEPRGTPMDVPTQEDD